MTAFGAGPWANLDEPVGGTHDGFVVFDDHHRVALVDEAAEDADHARKIPGVHAHARLIEDEHRVREAGAEARGQVDALDFAARERAREPIESEVAEPDRLEVAEARQDGFECVIGWVARILWRQRREQRA